MVDHLARKAGGGISKRPENASQTDDKKFSECANFSKSGAIAELSEDGITLDIKQNKSSVKAPVFEKSAHSLNFARSVKLFEVEDFTVRYRKSKKVFPDMT